MGDLWAPELLAFAAGVQANASGVACSGSAAGLNGKASADRVACWESDLRSLSEVFADGMEACAACRVLSSCGVAPHVAAATLSLSSSALPCILGWCDASGRGVGRGACRGGGCGGCGTLAGASGSCGGGCRGGGCGGSGIAFRGEGCGGCGTLATATWEEGWSEVVTSSSCTR
eukprot:1144238-Pelagomonas_calceolata.AAC.2